MRCIVLLFILVSSFQFLWAQNGTEPVLLTDLLKIKVVQNISVTKDGSKAAYTVTSIEADDKSKNDYRYITHIYSISTAPNSQPVQLTRSKDGASQPAWSPDGKQLAFVRAVDGRSQIFLLSSDGGEPTQLTKYKYGASNPEWSPNGKQLLFSSGISLQEWLKDTAQNKKGDYPLWPLEKPGIDNKNLKNSAKPDPNGNLAQVRAWLENNETDKKAIVLNKLNFQNEMNISSDISVPRFFIMNVQNPGEPIPLINGFFGWSNAEFTADGKQVIITGRLDSIENFDRSLFNEVYMVDTDGKNVRKILSETGKRFDGLEISPSGKWMAFLEGNAGSASINNLVIMPVNGSAKDRINIAFDRGKGNLSWSDDDNYLYFLAQSNGGTPLYRLNRNTKKIDTLSGTDTGIMNYQLAGNRIIYSKTQISNPSELYIADVNLKNEKQLTDLNAWVKTKKLSYPVKRSFQNEKGMQVEYWTMKPSNFEEGKKYPLLLEIHGGPASMWGPGEFSMWHEYQYFASKGYGIVYSNPRGSHGYGLEFARGNMKDWGEGPSRDVLTALDKAIADGWADTSKLMITGGSYAGYLTAYIIAHDKRFKAACAQRGVYDLATFFGEGNAWRLVPNYFGGYPWQPEVKSLLDRESPITYVQNITTPLIIFHGANDRRTGFVQGEMMYRSLKVLNRPVEYVVHPGATHEITRSGDNRQRMDQMLRTWEFFERWIH